MSEPTSPWLSVVTVVKDDDSGFARTADSLQQQVLDGVEWVVVDSSRDRDAVPSLIADRSVPARYSWTPPSGVYPAMNTGLAEAAGQYVYFLNAGDCLHDPGVLGHVRLIVDEHRPVWLYGQVCFVAPDGDRVTPAPFDYQAERRAHFSRGRFPAHQGTIVAISHLRAIGGFDESYRIVADYAAFLRLTQIADPAQTDAVLADFHTGGVSSTDWRASIREFHRARQEVLQLTGSAAAVERLNTASQEARMTVARWLGRV